MKLKPDLLITYLGKDDLPLQGRIISMSIDKKKVWVNGDYVEVEKIIDIIKEDKDDN